MLLFELFLLLYLFLPVFWQVQLSLFRFRALEDLVNHHLLFKFVLGERVLFLEQHLLGYNGLLLGLEVASDVGGLYGFLG